MNIANEFIGFMNNLLWTYVIIGGLLGLGVYFSVKTKFVQLRMIKEMFRILTDKAMVTTEGKKGVSSFQSFCIGAATRIGTGNLAGVAIAIAIGGPGAIFWMWVVALFGGATSFIESTLAQVYKIKDNEGFRGGPAYYMQKALNARWLGIIFAFFIALAFGLIFNAVQSNTISLAFESAFGTNRTVIGLALVGLTALVIFGGVKRIAKVSEVIVPIMAGFYIILGLYVMATNITQVPAVFALIFKSAFGLEQAVGGGIGAALMNGVKRGLFSNEAGMGSAPNAAATAVVSHPAKQGLIQTLGVFVDTLLVCSATGFIILMGDAYGKTDLTGIELLQASLESHVGGWAGIFIAISIFLFAYSSIIGSYYYGETNIEFIKKSKTNIFIYRIAVLGMVMFGALASLQIVWDLADLSMAFMATINLVALALLGKLAFKVLRHYLEQRKRGKDPVFYADSIPELGELEAWEKAPDKEEQRVS
ncbi:alanine/glycine:cation symporter family protein [Fictibacillus sp. BK138]|uniref:alanine/glycine:cation symporter family protein n=1 Tax=Fictibacillus sp. BK138 TaxID=2512121 RepID=UPI00102997F5|nr:alanine/glycine:cation symporter family protein [Fictibacillus sp. BK138]RZT21135.1 AGCS family alanine or glycine:cation symporter [Fictibacillus sp. BK138]